MIAYAQLCSIVHLAMCIRMWWVSGKTQDLKGENWSLRSIGLVVDVLKGVLMRIQEHPTLFLDQDFIMDIFPR
eukprot:13217758-Ditylum_brightwellii.AAC.1